MIMIISLPHIEEKKDSSESENLKKMSIKELDRRNYVFFGHLDSSSKEHILLPEKTLTEKMEEFIKEFGEKTGRKISPNDVERLMYKYEIYKRGND